MRLLVLLGALVLAFAQPSYGQAGGAAEKTAKASEPYGDEIAAFEAKDRLHPPPRNAVLFVGSSSIRMWPKLKSDFQGVKVIQRGFGGSDLRLVNWYAPRIVLPYQPRLIVLYAGDNDLAEGVTPQDVLQQFKIFAGLVSARLPNTRIAFVSIKPSPARVSLIPRMRTANELIRNYTATKPRLVYVDVYTRMIGRDGKPRADLYASGDGLHMNTKGYELWREILNPIVRGTKP
jgi:lysophospholipase L1-like esterase